MPLFNSVFGAYGLLMDKNDPTFSPARPNPVLAAVLVLCATAFFAGSTFLAKMLGKPDLGEPLHALQVTHARFLFAFLAVGLVALWYRVPPKTDLNRGIDSSFDLG